MSQMSQVLCCYKCEMFQVHHVKKSNKWQCKVCNEKQSLKKAFKIGPARDCRYLVQELNMQKCGHVQKICENSENLKDNDSIIFNEEIEPHNLFQSTEKQDFSDLSSRHEETTDDSWSEYNDTSGDDNRYFDSDLELCKENTPINVYHTVTENSKFNEAPQCKFVKSSVLSRLCETVEQCKPVIDGGINCGKRQRSPSETYVSISPQNIAPPPLKKNKGFQMILKAASKLNVVP